MASLTARSEEDSELVSAFCEMTQATRATGEHYLFTLGASTLEAAVSLYFDCGGAPAPATSTSSSAGSTSCSSGATKDSADGSEPSNDADSALTANYTSQAPVSQFSYPEGRSACTTIAVEATLSLTASGEPVDESSFSEPSKLINILTSGIEEYKKINAGNPVEHMACAEVLLMSEKYGNALEHVVVVQGTTEGSDAFLNELTETLRGALADGAPVCAVITKPPETVVCFVHPGGSIAIFDSHPRPTLGIEGAYVSGFSSIKAAAAFLRKIFPAVGDLGDSYMAQMYNSFDLTVLRRK